MTDAGPALTAHDLKFAYRSSRPVLCGVTVEAAAGSFTAILGPNGAGKTTLLKCLLGNLTPTGGQVLLGGRPLHKYTGKSLARRLAYVPQFPMSAFDFPVRELVLMGRFAHAGILGLASRQDQAVAHDAMQRTETLELAGRTLGEVSGGEAQRVMIARALAQQPSVMLLDEPTSHLDIRSQVRVYQLLQRLAGESGVAVLCAGHDINLAGRFADHLVLIRGGEVVASGPPADVIREDILQRTYGIPVRLVHAEGLAAPLVIADPPHTPS